MIYAYHFLANNGKLRDGWKAPLDGEWLKHPDEPYLCHSGLHASTRIIDALRYAPGELLCRVALRGTILKGDDKLVATERKIIWRIDAASLLRAFARHEALAVSYLWNPPKVVLQYLKTGKESLRDAARDAAQAAARYAAWYAARYAAQDAAWYAARYTARYAARYAAQYAAWYAAHDAALDAAQVQQEKTLLEFVKEARSGIEEWEFTI